MNDNYANLSVSELIARLRNAERVIEGQKKLLIAKDKLIQTTTEQYNDLLADYQASLSSNIPNQQGQSRRTSLNSQINNGGYDDSYTPAPSNRYNQYNDAPPETFAEPSYPKPTSNQPSQITSYGSNSSIPANPDMESHYSKRALQSNICFGEEPAAVGPKRTSIVINQNRKAMNDHFQDFSQVPEPEPLPPLPFDLENMSIEKMRLKVDELNVEKAAIERQLNKALPKGKIMSHIIREREDLEKQLENMNRMISQVKLEIRRLSNQ